MSQINTWLSPCPHYSQVMWWVSEQPEQRMTSSLAACRWSRQHWVSWECAPWQHLSIYWDCFTEYCSLEIAKFLFVILSPDYLISTNVCTWHDSWAVVSCAKFCRGHFIKVWLKRRLHFHQIGVRAGKIVSGMDGFTVACIIVMVSLSWLVTNIRQSKWPTLQTLGGDYRWEQLSEMTVVTWLTVLYLVFHLTDWVIHMRTKPAQWEVINRKII